MTSAGNANVTCMGEKNENNQIDSAGMVAALSPTTAENYLGDPKVVEWLLRDYANQCIQRRSQKRRLVLVFRLRNQQHRIGRNSADCL